MKIFGIGVPELLVLLIVVGVPLLIIYLIAKVITKGVTKGIKEGNADSSSGNDEYEKLGKLKDLLDKGAITQVEYDREKSRILSCDSEEE